MKAAVADDSKGYRFASLSGLAHWVLDWTECMRAHLAERFGALTIEADAARARLAERLPETVVGARRNFDLVRGILREEDLRP